MVFLQIGVSELAIQIGKIGLWIQAVGLLIVLVIVYYFVTMYYNRKRRLYLRDIDARLKRIEGKIDKLVGARSSRG